MNNELEFRNEHWMARSYRRYVQLGGRERRPENLCRFLRVVFVWSPLRRFFKGSAPLSCTPFGFVALCLLAVGILVCVAVIGVNALYNWIFGLAILWTLWAIVALFFTIDWFASQGDRVIRDWVQENVILPVKSIQTYRKARAGRFCPLITFTDER